MQNQTKNHDIIQWHCLSRLFVARDESRQCALRTGQSSLRIHGGVTGKGFTVRGVDLAVSEGQLAECRLKGAISALHDGVERLCVILHDFGRSGANLSGVHLIIDRGGR